MNKVFWLLVITILMPSLSVAEKKNSVALNTSLFTWHLYRGQDFNEDNEVLGLLYNDWFFTRYHNSHFGTSYGFGYKWKEWQKPLGDNLRLDTDLWFGTANGYDDVGFQNRIGQWVIVLLPTVELNWQISDSWSAGLNQLYVPTDQGGVFVTGALVYYHW